jgi:hypothetical protein
LSNVSDHEPKVEQVRRMPMQKMNLVEMKMRKAYSHLDLVVVYGPKEKRRVNSTRTSRWVVLDLDGRGVRNSKLRRSWLRVMGRLLRMIWMLMRSQ